MRCEVLFTFAAVVGSAYAIPQPGPTPTQHDPNWDIKGVSPKPTSGIELRSPEHLFKRQSDRTCGFIDADYQNAATCSSDYYCAYNTLNTVFGCCSGAISDCYIETACYPSKAAASSCDSSCLANPYNYICTAGAETLCYVYISVVGTTSLYNFGCGTEDYTSYVFASFTKGASSGVSSISSIKPVVLSIDTSTTPSSRKTEPPIGPSQTNPSPSSSSSGSPPTNTDKPKSTPVGAIAGGVVGGIAVLAIAGVGVFFLLRRKKSTPPPPPPVAQPPIQQQYDPKPNPYVQPYMQQQPGAPVGVASPHQSMSYPSQTSPPMSPPMSPAPPYADASQYPQYGHVQNVTVTPKGVHEVE